MLRAALASLLALASVWVGPVALPIDEYNDTFQKERPFVGKKLPSHEKSLTK